MPLATVWVDRLLVPRAAAAIQTVSLHGVLESVLLRQNMPGEVGVCFVSTRCNWLTHLAERGGRATERVAFENVPNNLYRHFLRCRCWVTYSMFSSCCSIQCVRRATRRCGGMNVTSRVSYATSKLERHNPGSSGEQLVVTGTRAN